MDKTSHHSKWPKFYSEFWDRLHWKDVALANSLYEAIDYYEALEQLYAERKGWDNVNEKN